MRNLNDALSEIEKFQKFYAWNTTFSNVREYSYQFDITVMWNKFEGIFVEVNILFGILHNFQENRHEISRNINL